MTIREIIDIASARCNDPNHERKTVTEKMPVVNLGLNELHLELVALNENYYKKVETVTLLEDNSSVSLPDNAHAVLSVSIGSTAGVQNELTKGLYQDFLYTSSTTPFNPSEYDVVGNTLYFNKGVKEDINVRVCYVVGPDDLLVQSDAPFIPVGFKPIYVKQAEIDIRQLLSMPIDKLIGEKVRLLKLFTISKNRDSNKIM